MAAPRLALALLLAACAAPEQPQDAFSYRVDPELEPWFTVASGRIYAASGVRLTLGGDTPLVTAEALPYTDGSDNCGTTSIGYRPHPFEIEFVTIEILWPQPIDCGGEGTVLHELIHSLRRRLVAVDDGDEHAEDGVFSVQGGNRLLTESSLGAMCEGVECGWFVPEVAP